MIFSQEEFNSRITKVKDSMNKKGIEILLTTDPSNMGVVDFIIEKLIGI